jgi:1-deoxy-D-xylulose-5-phosphate reductoisomerase|tara:strand:- start:1306 stop:2487 length:1182 start_codon:yes stop_codon:yes gene_type:complete
MKKINISVLGSTGSIGINTLAIISKKRNLFSVNTLSANTNYVKICNQLSKFNPRNFIIINKKTLKKVKKKFINSKTNFYDNYKNIPVSSMQNDITVAAIPGLNGLEPTIAFTRKSKKILLANKESIICGWNLLKNVAKKNNTEIIPIDSEHFSIKKLLKNYSDIEIEKIYITASGGPFLNIKKSMFNKIKPAQAIKHPKWSMGRKISVDSSTLMNKILELMEAQKIFPFKKNKYKIIIHPQSLVHAIISFKNGLTKFLYHEPNMQIPIANAIFNFKINIKDFIKNSKKNTSIKNLEFFEVDKTRFPVINLLPKMDKYISTPIIINAANEILIDQFLKKKISFNSISNYIFLVLKDKNYKKYAIYNPSNLKNIFMIDSWSRKTTLKIIANQETG